MNFRTAISKIAERNMQAPLEQIVIEMIKQGVRMITITMAARAAKS